MVPAPFSPSALTAIQDDAIFVPDPTIPCGSDAGQKGAEFSESVEEQKEPTATTVDFHSVPKPDTGQTKAVEPIVVETKAVEPIVVEMLEKEQNATFNISDDWMGNRPTDSMVVMRATPEEPTTEVDENREFARCFAAIALTVAAWTVLLVGLSRSAAQFHAPNCDALGKSVVAALRSCEECGESTLFLPLFGEFEKSWPKELLSIIYFLGIVWFFMGMGIVCDQFMAAIEEITGSERIIWREVHRGCMTPFHLKIWNPTIANLTLMALGSSAPEIMLSATELMGNRFFAGRLGPLTIVGSAAFNLFIISAVCVCAIPEPEVRVIEGTDTFAVTALFSLLAYIWMLVMLLVVSPDKIDIWEGVVTLLLFPMLLICAFIADKGWIRKFLQPKNEEEDMAIKKKEAYILYGPKAKDLSDEVIELIHAEQEKKNRVSALSKSLMRKQATKTATGSGQVGQLQWRKSKREDVHVTFGFAEETATVVECAGNLRLRVVASSPVDRAVRMMYFTTDGTAKRDERYKHVEGFLTFPPYVVEKFIEIPIIDNDKWDPEEEFYVVLDDIQQAVPRKTRSPKWSSRASRSPGGSFYARSETSGGPSDLNMSEDSKGASDRTATQAAAAANGQGSNAARASEKAAGTGSSTSPRGSGASPRGSGASPRCTGASPRASGGSPTQSKAQGGGAPSFAIAEAPRRQDSLGAPKRWTMNNRSASGVSNRSPSNASQQEQTGGGTAKPAAPPRSNTLHTLCSSHSNMDRAVSKSPRGSSVAKMKRQLTAGSAMSGFNSIMSGASSSGESMLAIGFSISVAKVTVVNDDNPGTLVFENEQVLVERRGGWQAGFEDRCDASKSITLGIARHHGTAGEIECKIETEDDTAAHGKDYWKVAGVVKFAPGERHKNVDVKIIGPTDPDMQTKRFKIRLTEASPGVTFGDGSGNQAECASCEVLLAPTDVAAGEKILGVFGDSSKRNEVMGQWADQVRELLYCGGGPEGQAEAGALEWACHMWALPWKMLFTIVPPPSLCNGWLCFVVALLLIGFVTAAAGDIASLLGCSLGIPDDITAITLVALGTSLPDTFASKSAAEHDETADNAVGNITGSNSVNVFLGVGISWTIGATYWTVQGPTDEWRVHALNGCSFADLFLDRYPEGGFFVPTGSIAFGVAVYTTCAFVCLAILTFRRRRYGGELGGPANAQYRDALLIASLWGVFVAATSTMSAVNESESTSCPKSGP